MIASIPGRFGGLEGEEVVGFSLGEHLGEAEAEVILVEEGLPASIGGEGVEAIPLRLERRLCDSGPHARENLGEPARLGDIHLGWDGDQSSRVERVEGNSSTGGRVGHAPQIEVATVPHPPQEKSVRDQHHQLSTWQCRQLADGRLDRREGRHGDGIVLRDDLTGPPLRHSGRLSPIDL